MRIYKILIVLLLISISSGILPRKADAQLLNTVVALTGNIFDAVSKEPVTVFVIVNDENGDRITATRSNAFENGYYYATGLKPGKKYTVILKKPKYFLEKYDIFIANSDKYEEISRDFLVKPLFEGAKIPLPVPPFELNKTKLRYGSEDLLSDLTNTLETNSNVKVEILCYPDDGQNKKENETITTERCKALKTFFVDNGVDASRISVKGSAVTDPDNPPPTKTRAKGKRYIGSSYIVVTEVK